MTTTTDAHRAPVITLGIGGVRARFETADPALALQVSFPRTRFVLPDDAAPDCAITVRVGDAAPGSTAPWFESGGPWEIRRGADGGDEVAFWTALPEGGRSPMMRLSLAPDLSRGELIVAPEFAPDGELAIGFPLDEYLTTRLLARRGAMVVHASSVAEGDGAYVFLGHSGAGKSTTASIAEDCGLRVLSDDRTVLRAMPDGTVTAAGTPWHGSYASGSPDAVRVLGIFLLEQAEEDRATAMEASRAFSEMMVRTIRPTAEPGEQLAIVDAVERVVHTVPVAALRFRPTPAVLDTVREFVAQ